MHFPFVEKNPFYPLLFSVLYRIFTIKVTPKIPTHSNYFIRAFLVVLTNVKSERTEPIIKVCKSSTNEPRKMDTKADLDDELMAQFQMFPNFYRPINDDLRRIHWIKFSPSGEKLVSASNRNTLDLYNCNTAEREQFFDLQKHGISTMDFIDSDDTILTGSFGHIIKHDYALRELNLTKKVYGACYHGHKAPVKSLAVNPKKGYFVSGGHDKAALLFDLRNPTAQIHCADLSDAPLVALHPTSDICALALDNSRIELYDVRSMNLGAFTIFSLNPDNVKWTSLKFSPNGKQLLISSNTSKVNNE